MIDEKTATKLSTFKPGARISCSDDEFYEEFMLRPDGDWEKMTHYTEAYDPFERIELVQQHELSDKPTDLERVAIHVLRHMLDYCECKPLVEFIEKTLKDPTFEFDLYTMFDPEKKGMFHERFDAFEREHRKSDRADWEAYYLLRDVGRYRRLGRPHPCPDVSASIGGIVNATSEGGFLTVSIVERLGVVANVVANIKLHG